jgi:hypothetical protein
MKYLNFCLISAIALKLFAGSVETDIPSAGYHPGETIPDIVLTDPEGNIRHLCEYRGKKAVVSFWATYHARSRANNVQLSNYLRESDCDVEFVSVAFDENRNVVERTLLLDGLNNSFRFCGTGETGAKTNRRFGLRDRFRSYLIDENGVIIAMNVTPEYLKAVL